MVPVSPVGMLTVTSRNIWSSSLRPKLNVNVDDFPAAALVRPATKLGANPRAGHRAPFPSRVISNMLVVVVTFPLHPVICALVVYVPQSGGFVSGAREPPLNSSWSFENGNWGLLSNVAVN